MLRNLEISPCASFGKHLSCAGGDGGVSLLTAGPLSGPVVSGVPVSLHLQPDLLLSSRPLLLAVNAEQRPPFL